MTNRRLTAVITGAMLIGVGVLLALVSAGLLWAEDRKDRDGFYNTGSERIDTTARAVSTDDLDVSGAPAGSVRLTVRGEPGNPVFIGVARAADVERYLAGAAHATIADVDLPRPFKLELATHPGTRAPGRPDAQGFWAKSTRGTGPQTLEWDVEDGRWAVVLMNADGSPGVHASVIAGARIPLLHHVMIGVGIAAVVLFLGGSAVTAAALVRPRRPRSWPAGSASAA